jgi:inorganic triphosphatase YgiF
VTEPRLESELKYRADDEAPLLALTAASALGNAMLGPARTVEERDRYLDTASLRLAQRRWACRLRTREGRTILSLKGPAEHAAGAPVHQRPEIEGPATPNPQPGEWPASGARDRLLEMTGDEQLVERLALAQRRTEREVLQGRSRVGLLSLDRVLVLRPGEIGRLLVVELEFDPAALHDGLDPRPFAAALSRVDGLRADPLTKLEHALDLLSAQHR